MAMTKRARRRVVLAAVVGGYAAGTVWAVRNGYSFGRDVTVRCRDGHLFRTVWIPGVSVKSLRLGMWRAQWCPPGRHVSLVHPVKPADITDSMRHAAAMFRDFPVP